MISFYRLCKRKCKKTKKLPARRSHKNSGQKLQQCIACPLFLKSKTVNWKNGWPVIHFVREETNQPAGHPTGYPEIRLYGNPYNQPSYFKCVKKYEETSVAIFLFSKRF